MKMKIFETFEERVQFAKRRINTLLFMLLVCIIVITGIFPGSREHFSLAVSVAIFVVIAIFVGGHMFYAKFGCYPYPRWLIRIIEFAKNKKLR